MWALEGYSFVKMPFYSEDTDTVAHQCGCEYVELNHSFWRIPFRSVGTGVVDYWSVELFSWFTFAGTRLVTMV